MVICKILFHGSGFKVLFEPHHGESLAFYICGNYEADQQLISPFVVLHGKYLMINVFLNPKLLTSSLLLCVCRFNRVKTG